jgi:hypothetical protein
MELAIDSHLLARILLTIPTLGYGFVTMLADFNATHATNPVWTAHSRFHVVWQILSYGLIALVSLGLIWISGPMETERLYLAAALGGAVFAAFFLAMLARPAFNGAMYDPNGIQPFPAPIGPKGALWDVNVTVFTALTLVLLVGIFLI